MLMKSLKTRSNAQLNDKTSPSYVDLGSINSIQDKDLGVDRKADKLKMITAGIAKQVLTQSVDEEQRQKQEREKQIMEIQKSSNNAAYLYGSKSYNRGVIKSLLVSIEPLNVEQRAQVQEKQMINEVFQQVESLTRLGQRTSITNLPQMGDQQYNKKQPTPILAANKQPLNVPSNLDISSKNQMSQQPQLRYKSQANQKQIEQGQKVFGLTQITQSPILQSSSPPQISVFSPQNLGYPQLSLQNQFSSQQYSRSNMQQNIKSSLSPSGGSNQPNSQFQSISNKKQNMIKNSDQYSFSDDFTIEMPNYQRLRTFFFKPLDRENMFEGMKYIQYEPYVRKDLVMQNVMTLDLTKILSDKCYSFKTTVSDKPKMLRVNQKIQTIQINDDDKIQLSMNLNGHLYLNIENQYEINANFHTYILQKYLQELNLFKNLIKLIQLTFKSLRPQQKIDVNKRIEETIAIQDAISLLIMQDFRDNLSDVGIGESPLEIHKQNRIQNLNMLFKNMHKNFYIEHVFNQIYDEEFQEKFMEQTLQEQYEILILIKKNLKTLCEKIQQKIEFYQENQDIYQLEQFKLEDDSEFKEHLKSIEAVIHQTKQLPSTHAVQEKKNTQKKPVKKKRLLDDSSFDSDKSVEILYEVFRTKPLPEPKSPELPLSSVVSRRMISQINPNSPQVLNNQVIPPAIQIVASTPPASQMRISKQESTDNANMGGNFNQNLESSQTPFKRKILRSFDSQHNTPQNDQGATLDQFPQNADSRNNTPKNQNQLFQQSSAPLQSQFASRSPSSMNNQIQSQGYNQQTQQDKSKQNNQNNKNNKKVDYAETNNKLMQEQHVPYVKMVIRDFGDEYLVFEDNLFLYEKTADFMRDCIDSYRIMCRQKDYTKFDEYSTKKFLKYCTKIRFNISELSEQFRQLLKCLI